MALSIPDNAASAAEALLDIANAMSSTLELKKVLKILARRAAQAIGAQRCSIDLWQDGRLMPVMSQFADGHADPDLWAKYMALGPRHPENQPTYVEAVRSRRPVAVDEVTDERWLVFGARALLMVPLLRQDTVLGTIHLDQAEPYHWTQAQIDFAMTIANQAALAADNARLYEQVRSQLRELQETQAQLLQAGKMAAVGKLVAGVAHELNNPLAVVLGQADLLTQSTRDPDVLKRTDKIRTSARRAAKIVRELTTFARPQPTALADVKIADVVDHALDLRRQALSVRGVGLSVEAAPDLPLLHADEVQLQQVVLNLLLNAEYAVTQSGRPPKIVVRLTGEGDWVRLAVSDSGPGIRPEVLPRIFEPFFTTKPIGEGTGLVLSISFRIVEAHGGRISAESAPDGGAKFVVSLPAVARAASSAKTPVPDRKAHVLVVDDEDHVAETFGALVEALGHNVTVARSGQSGWERLSAHEAQYDLVTLDLRMPDINGATIWERLVAARSPLAQRVAFITGDTVDAATQQFLARSGRPFIGKPVDINQLADLIRTAL
jgi:signal transduction histidine kinase/ActR/RegA family two-component response regulator